ncbi:DsbA family protein [Streptomyces sp. NPDC048566]|uniref:DsbA family protein n=1 Tax=Streptomyces sp. NPDC048566 TaxID=3365569 RepID=UPI00371B87A2
MKRGGIRRTVVPAVVTVLVGVLATGCGSRHAPADAGEHGSEPAKAFANSAELPERLAEDGTTVMVGAADADTVVHVYEDMRCPVCEDFEERGGGGALRDMTLSGEVRTEYTLASFLDDRLGGKGSRRAANALRAALEQDRFVEYHDVLFAHQPEESVDGYTDAFLLRMASKVPGLRGEEFDASVRTMRYGRFVADSERAYEADGADGTPAFAVDGKLLVEPLRSALFDESALPMVVRAVAAR